MEFVGLGVCVSITLRVIFSFVMLELIYDDAFDVITLFKLVAGLVLG